MIAVPARQFTRAIGVLLGGSGRALPRLDIKPRVAALLLPGHCDLQRAASALTVHTARS